MTPTTSCRAGLRVASMVALSALVAGAALLRVLPAQAESAMDVRQVTTEMAAAEAVAQHAGLVLNGDAEASRVAAGSTYGATVTVRTANPPVRGEIVAVETTSSKTVRHTTEFTLETSSWTTVEDEFVTTLAGSRVSLSVHVFDGGELEVQSSELASVAPAGWVLVEDVDMSDPTGWQLEDSTASNTASQDRPENVSFSASGMTIRGKQETTPNGSPYSSGDAKGTGHPIPNYARVEVVGRGPSDTGLWPAVLWLRPIGASDGEIDLMENFGGQPRVKATLHNQYGTGHAMIGQSTPWTALADPDPEALHTYVMEKTPNRITITVDGVVLMDAGPADAPAGFDWKRIFENADQDWYPRVTLQIGCGTANPYCETGYPDPTFRSTDMQVTELRIYRPAD